MRHSPGEGRRASDRRTAHAAGISANVAASSQNGTYKSDVTFPAAPEGTETTLSVLTNTTYAKRPRARKRLRDEAGTLTYGVSQCT